MRILDRERYWSFVKAYFICFVALVGLYVVIDAFSNIDEFAEVADSTAQLFRNMGRYYLIKMSLIYDQICGIITMMAAIFTVTWMQKNNELLAMLAAGISTQRVIRPVLISALAISSLAVVNQELIMPRLAEELQKPPDDDGIQLVKVYPRQDANDVFISGGPGRPGRAIGHQVRGDDPGPGGRRADRDRRPGRPVYIPEDDPTMPDPGGLAALGGQVPDRRRRRGRSTT